MVSLILHNDIAALAYGTVRNESIQNILTALIGKFIRGEEIEIFKNELGGVDAIKWKDYPDVLCITNDAVKIRPVNEVMKDSCDIAEEFGV